MADSDRQIAIAERLQTLLLEDYERVFTVGEPSAADRANLAKLLAMNGWSLDPARMPKKLRDMLGDPPALPSAAADDDDGEADEYGALRIVG